MSSCSRRIAIGLAATVSVAIAACFDPSGVHVGTDTPLLRSVGPLSAPENILAARIVFTAPEGALVHVAWWRAAGSGHLRSTPWIVARGTPDTVTILGLATQTTYHCRVETHEDVFSAIATFSTGALPDALQSAQMTPLSGTASHMALTAINSHGGFAVLFDTAGEITWYHDFSARGKAVSNVMQQPNGNITAFLGSTPGYTPNDGYYVEVTPEGEEVAEYHAPAGYYMDNHELVITGNGASRKAHFLTFTLRTLDLTSIGGRASVRTAGHQLVRVDARGAVEFMWDAWDHIGVDEWVGDGWLKLSRAITDYDHPNAITFDTHGNYVVSWRNLDQVMAIDPSSGAILWRLGGAKGQFAFVGDPFGGFSKQHAVKILPDGGVLLFDNGGDRAPPEARGVEYRLDSLSHTATMVWQYRHDPPLTAPYLGWAERLDNGHTWVAFSFLGRVVEVDRNGNLVWEGQLSEGNAGTSEYRIVPIDSLRLPSPR